MDTYQYYFIIIILNLFEVSRGCWLLVAAPLEEIKYLFKYIFSFFRFGVEAKRGVEFRHLTRNAFSIRRKMGNGVSI